MNAAQYLDALSLELGGNILEQRPFPADWLKRSTSSLRRTGLFEEQALDQLDRSVEGRSWGEEVRRLVAMTADILVDCFANLEHGVPVVPTIAPLPTRDFNAWALKAPNGEPICVVDVQLFGTLVAIASCVAECVFAGSESHAGNRQSAFTVLLQALLMFAGEDYHEEELRRTFPDIAHDPMRTFAAGQLAQGGLVFILAHEFSHHALGHTDAPLVVSLEYRDRQADTVTYNRQQLDEFAADALGLRAFLAYARQTMQDGSRRLFSQGEIAPLLFCQFLAVYEDLRAKLTPVSVDAPTHPAARDRLAVLGGIFEQLAHANAKVAYNGVREMFEHFGGFARDALN